MENTVKNQVISNKSEAFDHNVMIVIEKLRELNRLERDLRNPIDGSDYIDEDGSFDDWGYACATNWYEKTEDEYSAIQCWLGHVPTDKLLSKARLKLAELEAAELKSFEDRSAARCLGTITGDLLETIGDVSLASFCSRDYWTWEQEIATPILTNLGYTHIQFLDGERDGFGPLTRFAAAYKDGRYYELLYG